MEKKHSKAKKKSESFFYLNQSAERSMAVDGDDNSPFIIAGVII